MCLLAIHAPSRFKASDFFAKIRIADILRDTWAGFLDGFKIALVVQNGGMERPFGTAPWLTWVDRATTIVKNTMPINYPHLDDAVFFPEIPLFQVSDRHLQIGGHPVKILGIQ
jgi:hypothetical protein